MGGEGAGVQVVTMPDLLNHSSYSHCDILAKKKWYYIT